MGKTYTPRILREGVVAEGFDDNDVKIPVKSGRNGFAQVIGFFG